MFNYFLQIKDGFIKRGALTNFIQITKVKTKPLLDVFLCVYTYSYIHMGKAYVYMHVCVYVLSGHEINVNVACLGLLSAGIISV